jgi:hypothetical protein
MPDCNFEDRRRKRTGILLRVPYVPERGRLPAFIRLPQPPLSCGKVLLQVADNSVWHGAWHQDVSAGPELQSQIQRLQSRRDELKPCPSTQRRGVSLQRDHPASLPPSRQQKRPRSPDIMCKNNSSEVCQRPVPRRCDSVPWNWINADRKVTSVTMKRPFPFTVTT